MKKIGRPPGTGSKINRINMRVNDEFMDMLNFLQLQNPTLRNATYTQVIEYVLKEYVNHPLNHLGMMDLLDMNNPGKSFKQWKNTKNNS